MKRFLAATVLAFSGLATSTSASAQLAPPVTVTLDENGTGFATLGGEQSPLFLTTVGTDPGPGGGSNVLLYSFLAPEVLGDVVLIEPSDGSISDVVRFNEGSIAFYSDHFEPPGDVDSLGDANGTWPSSFYTNLIRLPEVGAEDVFNGATYTPTEGQPGFVAGFNVTYNLISDGSAVPEPATWAMMILGFGAIGFASRRRTARRALAHA